MIAKAGGLELKRGKTLGDRFARRHDEAPRLHRARQSPEKRLVVIQDQQ